VVSKEEEAALKEQEAARKRVDDKEKSLMGLYRNILRTKVPFILHGLLSPYGPNHCTT
jgi:hypothetical protein